MPMRPNSPLPPPFAAWFSQRGWQLREHQAAMLAAYSKQRSSLLIAPTGGGKTLAGFLPSLVDIHTQGHKGLHTLYISPLKALTHDIERNLLTPIQEMGLAISVESRTGDTSSYRRQKQRQKPPNILLTTPESLMLMLSYADAPEVFRRLRLVIVDESHSLAPNKRGDFTALALARLQSITGGFIRFGLSATVADPSQLAAWLGPVGNPVDVVQTASITQPQIRLLPTDQDLPLGGHYPKYAVPAIYQAISHAKTTLIFVNTRAQAEWLFQSLWNANEQSLAIALYHGSLSREQRQATEAQMAAGQLRAVVTTSALELGIDWGDVDLVIQVGAPKGVSRLVQRIGRSNHRFDVPSQALLVPSNRFDAIECQCAIDAIVEGALDSEDPHPGALDILPQYIVNCALSAPVDPDDLYRQITCATPYAKLERTTFEALFRFAENGGNTLRHYDRHHRLQRLDDGSYTVASQRVAQRHRQNIGTIVEAARLRVRRLRRKHEGPIIGEVEEAFAQHLAPGDSFMFAGEVLQFEGIKDMILEARPAKAAKAKVPAYAGGQLPLSSFLAERVRQLLGEEHRWRSLAPEVEQWLHLQQKFSALPDGKSLLVEQFPFQSLQYTLFYTFEGRKANQTLGFLLSRRMESMQLQPISFNVSDYALAVAALRPLARADLEALFSPAVLQEELEEWIMSSPMLKRAFRRVAMVSGLIEQRLAGQRKSTRQVTFSTDLIYDVLRRYENDHVLLQATRQEAERELLDLERLGALIRRFTRQLNCLTLPRASPLSIPMIYTIQSERIAGEGLERLLAEAELLRESNQLLEDVRHALG